MDQPQSHVLSSATSGVRPHVGCPDVRQAAEWGAFSSARNAA